ncbi:MAG: ABC transporter permease [Flavobacteriales bacterium]|nr:ABC transporter permease [Flavobacteriales bacterium]
MNKIKLIVKREYITKVRTRSFIMMSLLGPLFLVIVFGLIAFMASLNGDNKVIAIYDETSLFTDAFKDGVGLEFDYMPTLGLKEAIDSADERGYYGLLYLPFGAEKELEEGKCSMTYYSDTTPLMSISSHVRDDFEDRVWALKLKGHPDYSAIRGENQHPDVDVDVKFISYKGELKNSKNGIILMVIGALSGIMIYMFIFVYGVQVMKSVLEEKTNRIVEVIISSVKPFELMMGKIIGSALVGLTRFGLWTVLSGILLSIAKNAFGIESPSNKIIEEVVNPEFENEMHEIIMSILDLNYYLIIGAFTFFFLAGYLLYSAMFAAVGAAVDAETDTQQFVLPITLPLILALYSGIMVLENPHGPIAFWLSIIPFTSPIVMMARIPFDVPTWEIVLSMSILSVSFIFTTILAAKIYKTGILMYGNKVTYKDLWKWIRNS